MLTEGSRLGNIQAETSIINVLEEADKFLIPQDPMTEDLESVKPVYTAVFTFIDPTDSELGDEDMLIDDDDAVEDIIPDDMDEDIYND